jgi:hypothetical protein
MDTPILKGVCTCPFPLSLPLLIMSAFEDLTPSPMGTNPPSPTGGPLNLEAGPVVLCGQYLTRCVTLR